MKAWTAIYLLIFTMISCGSNPTENITIKPVAIVDSTHLKQGKTIFHSYCKRCHHPLDEHWTCNQTFNDIFERHVEPGELYFIKYIQDSKALKQSGDPYALHLDKSFDIDYEHFYKDTLTREDFYNLIVYIKAYD